FVIRSRGWWRRHATFEFATKFVERWSGRQRSADIHRAHEYFRVYRLGVFPRRVLAPPMGIKPPRAVPVLRGIRGGQLVWQAVHTGKRRRPGGDPVLDHPLCENTGDIGVASSSLGCLEQPGPKGRRTIAFGIQQDKQERMGFGISLLFSLKL